MKTLATFAAVLIVCGCVATPADPPDGTDGGCGADGLQYLIGEQESAVATVDLPGSARIIHPGDAVTMDFSPDRLNIEIGPDGRIAAVRCG